MEAYYLGTCLGQSWDFLRRPRDTGIPNITQMRDRVRVGDLGAAEILEKSLEQEPRY